MTSKILGTKRVCALLLATVGGALLGCQQEPRFDRFQPKVIIDLGAVITEDLAFRVWGKQALAENRLDRPNVFELVRNDLNLDDGNSLAIQNSFYTLANHGGPHVDAPVHVGLESGIDGYPVDTFAGPLKVVDVRDHPKGRSVPKAVFVQEGISPGDVVLIYTGWQAPGDGFNVITLTLDAAQYLAALPVRAFGTDAMSVFDADSPPVDSDDAHVRAAPIHHAFLSQGIPIYEQLFNVDQTLGCDRMYFVGAPDLPLHNWST